MWITTADRVRGAFSSGTAWPRGLTGISARPVELDDWRPTACASSLSPTAVEDKR
jgi:hypothetical protein